MWGVPGIEGTWYIPELEISAEKENIFVNYGEFNVSFNTAH